MGVTTKPILVHHKVDYSREVRPLNFECNYACHLIDSSSCVAMGVGGVASLSKSHTSELAGGMSVLILGCCML